MSLMDPLADALTNIRNNELQVNDSCVISPASKLIGEVLSTMQKENYMAGSTTASAQLQPPMAMPTTGGKSIIPHACREIGRASCRERV